MEHNTASRLVAIKTNVKKILSDTLRREVCGNMIFRSRRKARKQKYFWLKVMVKTKEYFEETTEKCLHQVKLITLCIFYIVFALYKYQ